MDTSTSPAPGLQGEWGHALQYPAGDTEKAAQCIAMLHMMAAAKLLSGTRYEIRFVPDVGEWGRTSGLAWYRSPKMDREPLWGLLNKDLTFKAGYYLVGQFTTPPPFWPEQMQAFRCRVEENAPLERSRIS